MPVSNCLLLAGRCEHPQALRQPLEMPVKEPKPFAMCFLCIYLFILANDNVQVNSQVLGFREGTESGCWQPEREGAEASWHCAAVGLELHCWVCVCAGRAEGGGQYLELCRTALQGQGNAESKQC